MKKITLGTIFIVFAGALGASAQILKPSVTINRDKASIIQRLPSKIQTFAPQIRLPQPDSENKNTAQNGRSLSSSFTVSADAMSVSGKGQVDFIGALLVTSTGSPLNIVIGSATPMAIIDAAGSMSTNLGGLGSNSVALTIKNNQAGSLYLVDCGTYGATSLIVNSGQPQTLTPNSNGHVYFVLTAGSNDDVMATMTSPNGMWAFFSAEISKLN